MRLGYITLMTTGQSTYRNCQDNRQAVCNLSEATGQYGRAALLGRRPGKRGGCAVDGMPRSVPVITVRSQTTNNIYFVIEYRACALQAIIAELFINQWFFTTLLQ